MSLEKSENLLKKFHIGEEKKKLKWAPVVGFHEMADKNDAIS